MLNLTPAQEQVILNGTIEDARIGAALVRKGLASSETYRYEVLGRCGIRRRAGIQYWLNDAGKSVRHDLFLRNANNEKISS